MDKEDEKLLEELKQIAYQEAEKYRKSKLDNISTYKKIMDSIMESSPDIKKYLLEQRLLRLRESSLRENKNK